jgi:hypothetical protein
VSRASGDTQGCPVRFDFHFAGLNDFTTEYTEDCCIVCYFS